MQKVHNITLRTPREKQRLRGYIIALSHEDDCRHADGAPNLAAIKRHLDDMADAQGNESLRTSATFIRDTLARLAQSPEDYRDELAEVLAVASPADIMRERIDMAGRIVDLLDADVSEAEVRKHKVVAEAYDKVMAPVQLTLLDLTGARNAVIEDSEAAP